MASSEPGESSAHRRKPAVRTFVLLSAVIAIVLLIVLPSTPPIARVPGVATQRPVYRVTQENLTHARWPMFFRPRGVVRYAGRRW